MARFFKVLAFNDGAATQAYLTIFSCAPCSPPCIIPLAEATASPPPPRGRLSVTSRRSSATSLWTSSRRWPPPPPVLALRSPMSFPTDRSSLLETRDSDVPRPCSSLPSLEWNLAASTRPPTTPS